MVTLTLVWPFSATAEKQADCVIRHHTSGQMFFFIIITTAGWEKLSQKYATCKIRPISPALTGVLMPERVRGQVTDEGGRTTAVKVIFWEEK